MLAVPRRPALLALLCLALVYPAVAADEDPARELDSLKSRIAGLEAEMRRETERRDRRSAELRSAEEAAAAAVARLEETRRELAAGRGRLARLEARRTELSRALAKDADALAAELRAAWMAGREPRLKLVLSQDDPARLGRMLAWYGYLARDRSARMAGLEERLAGLADVERSLASANQALAALEKRRTAEASGLEAARQERSQAVAALESRLSDRGKEVERLRAEAAALEKLVAELQSAIADLPVPGGAFGKQRGRLQWPASGALVRDFGDRRAGGLRANGVLLAIPRGTEVRAVWQGRVAYADWLPGLGLLLILDHGDGYLSLYGHNEVLFGEVGEWVQAGEVIARAGDSGGRDEAALYFEIRQGGAPQDPKGWFASRLPRRSD